MSDFPTSSHPNTQASNILHQPSWLRKDSFLLDSPRKNERCFPTLFICIPAEKVTSLWTWNSDFPEPQRKNSLFSVFSVGKREAVWCNCLPLCFLRLRPQVEIGGPENPYLGLKNLIWILNMHCNVQTVGDFLWKSKFLGSLGKHKNGAPLVPYVDVAKMGKIQVAWSPLDRSCVPWPAAIPPLPKVSYCK